MAFILCPFPRSIRVSEEHPSVTVFALGKVSKFGAVVDSNSFEYLCKTVAEFHFECMHDRHDDLTSLSMNQKGYVVFCLLFQESITVSFPDRLPRFPNILLLRTEKQF